MSVAILQYLAVSISKKKQQLPRRGIRKSRIPYSLVKARVIRIPLHKICVMRL